VLIEGDRERFLQIEQSITSFPSVKAFHALVAAAGPNTLDSLLSREGVSPDGVDLLSIDIDGDDYHVWSSLTTYRPRVVVVEYNPTIPPELDLVQRQGEYFGASAAALTRLARDKGYGLAACTATNCIYVYRDEFPALGIAELDLSTNFDRSQLCYVINAYDGRTFLATKPVYSRPLPLASFEYWWERLRQNLLVAAGETILPVEDLQPVSLVLESTLRRRSLKDRVLATFSRTITRSWDHVVSLVTALPPYRLVERLVQALQRRAKERAWPGGRRGESVDRAEDVVGAPRQRGGYLHQPLGGAPSIERNPATDCGSSLNIGSSPSIQILPEIEAIYGKSNWLKVFWLIIT
jgi:hypothetical protein